MSANSNAAQPALDDAMQTAAAVCMASSRAG